MSFALTEDQVLSQRKDVTRRMGWLFLKPGDLIQPVRKCMGLKKGEKQVKLGCPIRVVSITREQLNFIDPEDVKREGFPEMTPKEFMSMYAKANRCDWIAEVTRIEFEYTEPLKNFEL